MIVPREELREGSGHSGQLLVGAGGALSHPEGGRAGMRAREQGEGGRCSLQWQGWDEGGRQDVDRTRAHCKRWGVVSVA